MPLLSLPRLLNWSLLLRHVLAVVCLAFGIRQLLFIRHAKLMGYLEQHGPSIEALQHFPQDGNGSLIEQITELRLHLVLAPFAPLCLVVILSWLIVTRRRERRAIPLLVLLIDILISRLGFYESTLGYLATNRLHGLLDGLAVAPRLWLIGLFWTGVGLLLLLSTWPFRRAGTAQFSTELAEA